MAVYRVVSLVLLCIVLGAAQPLAQISAARAGADVGGTTPVGTGESLRLYTLGPEDTLSVKVLNVNEIGDDPYPIDLAGNINLPVIGVAHAAGLTVNELQAVLGEKFREYVRTPGITISVAEFRSQPISVLGAVVNPGIHQMRGRKTLFEVISEAGGLKAEAGNTIKITRRKEFGNVPLSGALTDSTKQFSIGEVTIRSVMQAQSPAENITVKPFDVITVPKADLIYVIGDVKKPGGFPLSERPTLSLLEALALAEGLERTAGPKNSKILRVTAGSASRSEIPIDVRKILDGRNTDVTLFPNDILFIPNSAAKSASARAIEAMIQVGTGVMIYSRF
jgi:polysaccharide export outer membrane protein